SGMRRHSLHITVASIAFAWGFLTVGNAEELANSLWLVMGLFILAVKVPRLRLGCLKDLDSHKLLVTALTTLLSIPVIVLFVQFIPRSPFNDCLPYARDPLD